MDLREGCVVGVAEAVVGQEVGGGLHGAGEDLIVLPGGHVVSEAGAGVFEEWGGGVATEIEGAGGSEGFDGDDHLGEADTLLELEGGGHAHADEVLLIATGRDGAGGGGAGEDAHLGDKSGGGDLRHHEAGLDAGAGGEEGGQALVQGGIEEALGAALGDAGELVDGDGEVVEGEGEWSAVEVAAGDDLVGVSGAGVVDEDERIVRGTVEFGGEDAAGFGEGIPCGTVDLGDAAEAVGVLDAGSAGAMGSGDGGALEECEQVLGAVELAGMGAGVVEAGVEGCGGAAESLQGEGGSGLGGVEEGFEADELEAAEGEHGLGAVEQGDALFGEELDGVEAGLREGFGGGEEGATIVSGSLSDEGEGHVGEGREVSAGAYAAARGDDGRDVVVEQVADALGDEGTDAGEAFGQDVGADEHHAADDSAGQRLTHATAVGADEVELHLLEVVVLQTYVGEESDAGVEGVDGLGSGDGGVYGEAGGGHGGDGPRG